MPRSWATPAGAVTQRFWAMDSEILVILPGGRAESIERVRTLFEGWEAALSRFRSDSALSRMNASAGRPVQIHEPLLGVLRRALAAAGATGGIFDPTMGADLADLGYSETFFALPDVLAAKPSPKSRRGSWHDVRIGPGNIVRIPAGIGIDLGGIAKGMAVDAALAALGAGDVPFALVSAGGDLAVRGRPPGARDWAVAVGDESVPATVGLRAGALATSSTERRRWQTTAGSMHHLLDPRTGTPSASELVRVTVHAPTCEGAEIAAKAALILGLDRGTAFLERAGLAGLLRTRSATHPVGAWPVAAPGAAA
jgi:FAD:protein FMN transferase